MDGSYRDGSYRSNRSLYTEQTPSNGLNNSHFGDPLTDPDMEDDVYYDAVTDQNRTDILKLILYDLNSAIAPQEIRLMAIHAALEEFDHDDELLHDEELDLRADHILLQKLTYAMCLDPGSVEVGYICSAMECVYRAGRTRLAQSFHEICDALLPLFVEMIRPPSSWSAVQQRPQDNDVELLGDGGEEEKKDSSSNNDPLLGSMFGGGGSEYDNPSSTHSHSENKQPQFMEPIDPAQQTTYYGDYDEESAESVEIPSGVPSGAAGEYFEEMNRMSAASDGAAEEAAEGLAREGGGGVGGGVGGVEFGSESGGVFDELGDDIPQGTGEYMEEMKRRQTSAAAAASAAGAPTPTPTPTGGGGGGSNVAHNALALHPVGLGNTTGQEQKLVPRSNVQPHPTSNATNPSAQEQQPHPGGQQQQQQQPPHPAAATHATDAQSAIRMELNAAQEAMQNQKKPSGSVPTKRLSIEADGTIVPKRLSIEADPTTAVVPLAVEPSSLGDEEALRLRGGGVDDDDDDDDHEEDKFAAPSIRPLGSSGKFEADSDFNDFDQEDGSEYAQEDKFAAPPIRPIGSDSEFNDFDDEGGSEYDQEDKFAAPSIHPIGSSEHIGEIHEDEDVQDKFAAPSIHPISSQSEFNDFTDEGRKSEYEEEEEEDKFEAPPPSIRPLGSSGKFEAVDSDFNDLVHEGGGSEYSESQDNPFSDSSSFKNYGGGGSSASGVFSDTAYSERSKAGNQHGHHGVDGGDNPFSDTSSFRNPGSVGAFSGTAYDESKVARERHEGADEDDDAQGNPFSDTSSCRNLGGSSRVGGFGESSRGGGFTEGSGSSGHFQRDGEFNEESGRNAHQGFNGSPNNIQDEYNGGGGMAGSASQGASEFDDQGGYSGAAPSVFSGYEDEDTAGGRGQEEDAQGNPFSDTSSFRNAGGSSVGGFSESRGGGFTERENNDHYPPSINEFNEESGRNVHQGFDGSPNNIQDEYNGGGGMAGSASQGASVFDDQGGYSGAAPSVFSGYDDASSYGRSRGPEFNEAEQDNQESEYVSAHQGFEGGNHHFDDQGKPYSEAGFSEEAGMRRQSEFTNLTDEWGDQSETPMDGQFSEGMNNMYMPESSGGAGLGMMSELDANHLSSEPEHYPPRSEASGQYQMEGDHEEKYSEVPYESNPHGHIQDEDIFQFKEPQLSMSPQDYFNYSDPVEGEICPLAIRKVLKILRYFSRVLSAMEPLAQHSGLVDALLYHMTKKPHSVDYEEEISSRVDAIAVVVNLACAEENKIMLVYHPGLLDAVIKIANHDPIDEAREHAAIVLMNLAYAEENKVHMVNQDHLLDTLVHLLSDVSPFTRRYASAALFTLACTYANTAVMARHCDGGILEALRKVLLNDPIDEARVNAAEALFNMARNNSDDTVENMGNHSSLLASLAHSVLTDYSADVRAYSARALEWLSADIHYPMPCHRILLKTLTTASQWTKTTCIAEALKMQASLSENRKPMVEHPGLLDALATLSLLDGITDDEVKTCAISALERLSKEASTRHIMVKNEGVMTALTKATFAEDGAEDDTPEGTPTALLMKTALKNLAEHM